ncbi:MAG: uracil-DNA glycosylase [Gammaproteobacteria bacterium]
MNVINQQYLDAMGIQQWVLRNSAVAVENEAVIDLAEDDGETPGIADRREEKPGWQALQQSVSICTACELQSSRTQTVFGVGNPDAEWLIIGEAPGADEDRQGEPFVGRAGQLLNAMLLAIGLRREEVYIANILKCRPPGNRDPRPEEVTRCEAFLQRQIELVEPKVILAVGRIAAQNILKTEAKIGALRGKSHQYRETGIPVVVTYHPAYLLRSPKEKRKAWEDLKLARKVVSLAR